MAEKKFKGISVITAGPALGHGMVIDADTLTQVVERGNESGQVKVLSDHSSSISNIIGYLENFSLDGVQVRADLTLFQSHDSFGFFSELISTLPGQIGFSISFSGIPRTAEDGTTLADVQSLYSVDLVLTPAANPSGIFQARVDKAREPMIENKELKSEALAEAAPVAPAAPVEEAVKAAEPTLSDINAKLDAIMAMLTADAVSDVVEEPMAAKVDEKKLEVAVAQEPVLAEAKVEEVKAEEPVANETAALKAELSAKVIELEASRGIKPIEVESSKQLSRGELLAQFNAEKNPRRAAEIFKQIKFAR
jgi:phage head maturation protease